MSDGPRSEWMAAERDRMSVVRELQRLKRRAKARPIGFLMWTVLLAGAVVFMRARKDPLFKARVIMRVTEGTLNQDQSPLPRRELRDYVTSLAFTRAHLLQVIQELDLYPTRAIRGDDWAIEQLRANLGVDVYRNYFANERGYATSQRSARIGVVFRGKDPDRTVRVARRMAELIAESENQQRRELATNAVNETQRTLARARQSLLARQVLVTQTVIARSEARHANDTARAAQLTAELDRLEHQLKAESDRVSKTESALTTMKLRLAMEGQQMGLSFEIVDERLPEKRDDRPWIMLTALGVIAFLVLLPLCAIGVAAFDSRVHEAEDVERLRMAVVGHVPGFSGDGVGSLRRRGATRNRVP